MQLLDVNQTTRIVFDVDFRCRNYDAFVAAYQRESGARPNDMPDVRTKYLCRALGPWPSGLVMPMSAANIDDVDGMKRVINTMLARLGSELGIRSSPLIPHLKHMQRHFSIDNNHPVHQRFLSGGAAYSVSGPPWCCPSIQFVRSYICCPTALCEQSE